LQPIDDKNRFSIRRQASELFFLRLKRWTIDGISHLTTALSSWKLHAGSWWNGHRKTVGWCFALLGSGIVFATFIAKDVVGENEKARVDELQTGVWRLATSFNQLRILHEIKQLSPSKEDTAASDTNRRVNKVNSWNEKIDEMEEFYAATQWLADVLPKNSAPRKEFHCLPTRSQNGSRVLN
jgi:hypothetical protein